MIENDVRENNIFKFKKIDMYIRERKIEDRVVTENESEVK